MIYLRRLSQSSPLFAFTKSLCGLAQDIVSFLTNSSKTVEQNEFIPLGMSLKIDCFFLTQILCEKTNYRIYISSFFFQIVASGLKLQFVVPRGTINKYLGYFFLFD